MNLEQWVLLEQRLRLAPSVDALQLILVNGLRQVIPYTQAVLFECKQRNDYAVRGISHISEINPQSPVVQWINHSLAPWLSEKFQEPSLFSLQAEQLPEDKCITVASHGLYLPLHSPYLGVWGLVLWFTALPDSSLVNASSLITQASIHAWERLILLKKRQLLIT